MTIRLSILVAALAPLLLVSACSPDSAKNIGNLTPTPGPIRSGDERSSSNVPANVSVTPGTTQTKTHTEPGPPGGRIQFVKGDNSTIVSGSVIRGERAEYRLGAKAGQTMTVNVTSVESNAVFQIEDPKGSYLKGAGETDDAMSWSGYLPADGDYKIIVGGTRGNAEFKLTVSIK